MTINKNTYIQLKKPLTAYCPVFRTQLNVSAEITKEMKDTFQYIL